jgi:hypothetical protein
MFLRLAPLSTIGDLRYCSSIVGSSAVHSVILDQCDPLMLFDQRSHFVHLIEQCQSLGLNIEEQG